MKALANLCELVPARLGPLYAGRIPWLMSWISNDSELIRYHVSRIIGTASLSLPLLSPPSDSTTTVAGGATAPAPTSVSSLLRALVALNAAHETGSRVVRFKHGAVAAMGHVLACVLTRVRALANPADVPAEVHVLMSEAVQVLFKSLQHELPAVREVRDNHHCFSTVGEAHCAP